VQIASRGRADKPGNSGDSHQNDAEEKSIFNSFNRFFFVSQRLLQAEVEQVYGGVATCEIYNNSML
jgi:hypothetical protein